MPDHALEHVCFLFDGFHWRLNLQVENRRQEWKVLVLAPFVALTFFMLPVAISTHAGLVHHFDLGPAMFSILHKQGPKWRGD